jgi:hypothetical protein
VHIANVEWLACRLSHNCRPGHRVAAVGNGCCPGGFATMGLSSRAQSDLQNRLEGTTGATLRVRYHQIPVPPTPLPNSSPPDSVFPRPPKIFSRPRSKTARPFRMGAYMTIMNSEGHCRTRFLRGTIRVLSSGGWRCSEDRTGRTRKHRSDEINGLNLSTAKAPTSRDLWVLLMAPTGPGAGYEV